MTAARDAMKANLPKHGQQNVADEFILGGEVEIGSQLRLALLFLLAERPVRVGGRGYEGLGSEMAQVALFVVGVERLEAFPIQGNVDGLERA